MHIHRRIGGVCAWKGGRSAIGCLARPAGSTILVKPKVVVQQKSSRVKELLESIPMESSILEFALTRLKEKGKEAAFLLCYGKAGESEGPAAARLREAAWLMTEVSERDLGDEGSRWRQIARNDVPKRKFSTATGVILSLKVSERLIDEWDTAAAEAASVTVPKEQKKAERAVEEAVLLNVLMPRVRGLSRSREPPRNSSVTSLGGMRSQRAGGVLRGIN